MQLQFKKLYYVDVLEKYLQWFYLNDTVRWKAAYFNIKGTDPLTKIVLELPSDW